MPHRDTSEWDDDLIAYTKARWGAVPCEEHPHCLRDATDDELCERVRQNILKECEELMGWRGIMGWDGQVRS